MLSKSRQQYRTIVPGSVVLRLVPERFIQQLPRTLVNLIEPLFFERCQVFTIGIGEQAIQYRQLCVVRVLQMMSATNL